MEDNLFYYLLWSNLVAMCPYDTGNMQSNIKLYDYGDYWEIEITAPNEKSGDYAKDVNYALKAKRDGRAPKGKEIHNYMWVERTIKQTAESISGSVSYEL